MRHEPAFAAGDEPATMVEVLRRRQRAMGASPAITFLVNGLEQTAVLTYAELDRRARAIAAYLQARGAAGRAVVLALPPGLDFPAAFFGCLYARAIAVPIASKRAEQPELLAALVDDSDAVALLTSSAGMDKLASCRDRAGHELGWTAVDRLDPGAADHWVEPSVAPTDTALFQYTSGSTSAPKAVMVSHGNLIHNVGAQLRAYECSSRTIWVSWLPTFHDMGLVAGTLAPVYGGFPAIAMSPLVFVKRPLQWLQALSHFRGTISVAPNFAFDACVERSTPEERAGLDLSSWEAAVNGAEPVRPATLDRFARAFAPAGFRRDAFVPGYGLAEATLCVSAGPASHPPVTAHVDRRALASGRVIDAAEGEPGAVALAGCGQAAPGQTIAIVDPHTRRRCPDGRIGEIWVAGPSVAQGYWNRREATEATFGARVEGSGEGPFLRSGDLGFLRRDELFVTGRLKDIVIVRGQNHYPQDLEQVAEAAHRWGIPGGTAAFSLEVDGEERLVIVQGVETRDRPDPDEIYRAVRRAMSEQFDLATFLVVLIRRRSVLRTTSGKIQRRATRSALIGLELDVFAASAIHAEVAMAPARAAAAAGGADDPAAIEATWLRELAAVLGRDVPAGDRDLRVDRLGVTLETAIALDARLAAVLGVRFPIDLVLARASLAQITARLVDDLGARAAGTDAAPPAASPAGDRSPAAPPRATSDPGGSSPRGAAAIEAFLAERLAARVGCPPTRIRRDRPFAEYGLGSAEATALVGEVERWLGAPVSPTLPWDHPSVAAAARALARQHGAAARSPSAPRDVAEDGDAIAVVGMSCRLPGAPDLDAFRELLREGRAAITRVPPDRWDADALFDPAPGTPGMLSTRWGGFLDDVDRFDPRFFGVSSREAARMDPQQRLLLEETWRALEDAGRAPDRLAGTRTGVFVGISSQDYARHQLFGDRSGIDAHAASGTALSVAANRISYLLDLRGPSMAIDTACSSSLVALHQACRSLRAGECDLAVVGGVNVLLAPELTIAFSHARMMAADGRCKTFDAGADGYVRGEGCGVVILRRLAEARAGRDRVLAVVRGSAVGHGGRSNGLTAPSGPGQEEVLRAALADARVSPERVSYVEAHGTGTSIGDAIEVQALRAVFGGERARPCWIGSVKTNLGHLEAAAGIAGFIKVVLALGAGELPRHLNVERPNPLLALESGPLQVVTEPTRWDADGTRLAGVSSFGFGGANAHVVVEEAPPRLPRAGESDPPGHLLCLSGRSPAALAELAGRLVDRTASLESDELADAWFTASRSRAHQACRAALAGADPAAIRDGLGRLSAGQRVPGATVVDGRDRGRPSLALLFSGQGAQVPGMGRQLLDAHPVFRAAIDRCAAALTPHLDVSLRALLFEEGGDPPRLHDTRYTQPALVAFEWALAELWQSLGVVPEAVLGHSVGEYTAACVAGALSIEDALALVATRGRLMAERCPPGAMLAVIAPADQVHRALADGGGHAVIAALNGASAVVSGNAAAVASVRRRLEADRVQVHPLDVSHAFHSPLIEPMLDELEAAATAITWRPLRLPLASNSRGELLPAGTVLDAASWRRHTREPVRFADGIQALRAAGHDVFLEVGPRATLTSMARRVDDPGDRAATWIASLRAGQPEWTSLLAAAGELFTAGVDLETDVLDPARRRRLVALPTSPFERERHWIDRADDGRGPFTSEDSMSNHPGHPHSNGTRVELAWEVAAAAEPEHASNGAAIERAREPAAAAHGGNAGAAIEAIVGLFREQTAALVRLCGASDEGISALAGQASGPEPAVARLSASGGTPIRASLARRIAPVHALPSHRPAGASPDPGPFVLTQLSAVCGFPAGDLRRSDRIADLGLDSLMVSELRRRLQPLVPGVDIAAAIPVTGETTVGDVIDLLARASGGAPRADALVVEAVMVEPAMAVAAPELAHAPAEAASARGPDAPGASRRAEDWPEYAAVDRLMAAVEAGGGNPYARLHASRNAESTVVNGKRVVNYASFNYLGFSADPVVCQAAHDAINRYGTSASATPLLFGETPLHAELERELCGLLGTEAALLFASGHATNVTTVGHLAGPDDLILHDELIHDSTVRGALLSGARRLAFPHNDHAALDGILTRMRARFRRVLVSIEGVYSQDGDIPDLLAFARVKARHGALLMVDEAHSLGVIGARGGGIGEHFGIDRAEVDIWMGTLSKALGSCGGYIAGSAGLVKLLKHSAPGYIFATSVSPPNAGAALAALRLLRMSSDRVERLQANARLFVGLARERGMDTGRTAGSAVIPILVGSLDRAIRVSEALLARGINAMPIGYPAVAPDQARLRFFASATHTEDQIRQTIDVLADELERAATGRAAIHRPATAAPTVRGRIQTAIGRFANRAIEATHRSDP